MAMFIIQRPTEYQTQASPQAPPSPTPGSAAWQAQINANIQSQMQAFQAPPAPVPSAFQSATRIGDFYSRSSLPGAAASAAGPAGEDPRLTSILAQLRGQAGNSDSVINDQAAASVAAQRTLAQQQLDRQVKRSLASSGLLPTGGQSERMRSELAAPMEAQLAAAQESSRQNLIGQRTNTANNLAGQLSDLQRQQSAGALDRQRFDLESQSRQQQFGMDQQRFAWEQQQAAQQSAYQQAMQAYNMQQTQLETQLRQQAIQQSAQQGYANGGQNAPGGSMTGSVSGWAGGQNSFLASGQQPRDTYNNSVARGGQNADFYSNSNQALRAEQAERGRVAQAAQPAPWRSVDSGNGMSSAGAQTGLNGGVSAAGATFNNYGSPGSGNGSGGSYMGNAAQNAWNAATSAAGSSGYGRSMY